MRRKAGKIVALAGMLLGFSVSAGPTAAADPFGAEKALPKDLSKVPLRPEVVKGALEKRVDLAVVAVKGPGCVCPEELLRESVVLLGRPGGIRVHVQRGSAGARLRAKVELTVPLLAAGARTLVPVSRTFTREIQIPAQAGVVETSIAVPRLLVGRLGRSITVKVTPLDGFEEASPANNQVRLRPEDLCVIVD